MAYFRLLLTIIKTFTLALLLVGVQYSYAQESTNDQISVQQFENFLLEQNPPIGTCEQEYLLEGLSRLEDQQLIDTSRLEFLYHQYAFLIQDKNLFNSTLPSSPVINNHTTCLITTILLLLTSLVLGLLAAHYFHQNKKKKQDQLQLEEKIKVLERENNKAQRSQSLLQSISATLSHDYKEPLRNISFFTKIIESDISGSKIPTQESFSFIYKSIDSIERLISSFSNFLTVGENYSSIIEEVPVYEAFKLAKENLASQIKTLNVNIQWKGDKQLRYPMDKTQMVSVFQNLIGNSIKYRSDKTPEIEVVQKVSNSALTIEVIDNGLGISEEWRDEIFQPFVRLNRSNDEKGSGLGLSIVKKAITNLDGEISYATNPKGGSTFIIELPLPRT